MNKDEAVRLIVKKFINQAIVFGNWFLNYILRTHPELADNDEICEFRKSIRELTEEEKHL